MPVFTSSDALRPGFSLAMEILCTIPKAPCMVRMRDMVKDFNLRDQAEAQDLLNHLRAIGFEICVTNNHGRVAFMKGPSWDAAQVAAKNYWETVWGELKHTAQDLGAPPPRRPSAAA